MTEHVCASYFDTRFPTMLTVKGTEGIQDLCYRQQAALVEEIFRSRESTALLDVGCGPALPYRAGDNVWIHGLDPSAASLEANGSVRHDTPLLGTAEDIPLTTHSIDLTVAFYSLHHMTGQTPRETSLIRRQAFAEMYRVTKHGGEILVFEVSPWPLANLAQRLLWPLAKRLFGDRLDAYFWTAEQFREALPLDSFSVQTFDCSPFAMFPPAFSMPWLRIPRFLFPFNAVMYRWKV